MRWHDVGMASRGPTPRELARSETLTRIKALALSQLADASAGELSLRAIARELNIVSSAIYRYYPSRDELITDLIVDGYTDLAATIAAAASPSTSPRDAWLAGCAALRAWSTRQPHRFGLLYGSTIPGYAAPATTIEPAAAVVAALFTVTFGAGTPGPREFSPALRQQAASVEEAFGTPLSAELAVGIAHAFAALIGALTLELGGHFVGTFDPADQLFADLVDRQADALGLEPEQPYQP